VKRERRKSLYRKIKDENPKNQKYKANRARVNTNQRKKTKANNQQKKKKKTLSQYDRRLQSDDQ
jgi:hypothetical protein